MVSARRQQFLINATKSVIDTSVRITAESHPKLFDAVQQLCRHRGIQRMPGLWKNPFMDGGAIKHFDAIVISDGMLEHQPHDVQVGLVAHEFAHLLRGDEGPSRRIIEHATDRLAVSLLGDRKPLEAVVRMAATKDPLEGFIDPKTWQGRILRGLFGLKQRQAYGTHEQRLASVLRSDPKDTHLLKILVDRRNREYPGSELGM